MNLGCNGNPVPEAENPAVEEDSHEVFRQMQLDMLRRENQALSSKLDALTESIRSHSSSCDTMSASTPPTRRPFVQSKPSHHLKVPGGSREILLVFEGDLATCDRQVICAKLLHLKRLLHRRLESRLSPSPEATGSLMHALLAVHQMAPPSPEERIRVQAAQALASEQQESLKREIASLISFTQGISLEEDAVSIVEMKEEGEELFQSLSPMIISRPARVQIIVTAFNHGVEGEQRILDSTLSELCEPDSIAWEQVLAQYFGSNVNVGWVNKDLQRPDDDEATVVCSSHDKQRRITLYYPAHLQSFFRDQALRRTLEPGNLLHTLLADHIDFITFQEWRAGSISVPVHMPEWLAVTVWELARSGDQWLSFMTSDPHPLREVRLDTWSCAVAAAGRLAGAVCCGASGGCGAGGSGGGGGSGSVSLFFALERQQEVMRRRIGQLERLVQCKRFVEHMDRFTRQLHSRAEELCSDIRLKQETTGTLDALTWQLTTLSLQCASAIDTAMDAVHAVGAEGAPPEGEAAQVHRGLVEHIRQAQTAKEHVDSLKDRISGALQTRLHSPKAAAQLPAAAAGNVTDMEGDVTADAAMGAMAAVSLGASAAAWDAGAAEDRSAAAAASGVGRRGFGAMDSFVEDSRETVGMLRQIQAGLEFQREHQEKLIRFWLAQHDVMRSELNRMLAMASASARAGDGWGAAAAAAGGDGGGGVHGPGGNVDGGGGAGGDGGGPGGGGPGEEGAAAGGPGAAVEALEGRFREYMAMLEEHEEVEDKMLFPMLKTLFPQSSEVVDRILDPERHKGVDMLTERVGGLLQELHERQRAGQGILLSVPEMKKVVEALERLTDYMDGHIRYEEEVTMPWLKMTPAGPYSPIPV